MAAEVAADAAMLAASPRPKHAPAKKRGNMTPPGSPLDAAMAMAASLANAKHSNAGPLAANDDEGDDVDKDGKGPFSERSAQAHKLGARASDSSAVGAEVVPVGDDPTSTRGKRVSPQRSVCGHSTPRTPTRNPAPARKKT